MENNLNLIDLLANDNYIIVNKSLIKAFGLNEAVLMGELCSEYRYWYKEGKLENDMFYSTIENIEENTGLSAHEQRQAIQSLKELDVLEVELKGIPAKRYFKLRISTVVKILTTCCLNFKQLAVKKLYSNNNNNSNNKQTFISKDMKVENFQFGVKNKKQNKPNLWDNCISLIYDFTDDKTLQENLIAFLSTCLDNSRESGKSFYTNNFKGKLNSLRKLADDHGYLDVQTAILIVKQTLDNGWNGFYALNAQGKDVFSQQDAVKSESYTVEEMVELNKQDEERKKKGLRTIF